jgi:hypothetical protein
MSTRAPTFTTMSFRALVEAADPNFYKEGTQPIVYRFPNGADRRDPKPLYNFEPDEDSDA